MSIFTPLQMQYVRLEQSIRDYVKQVLGVQASSYTSSNIFGMIINIIRGICQNIFLYLEDAVQEQNILTATRRNSIFSLAKISGYEPFYGYAASGTVNINLLPSNGSTTSRLQIPNLTRIQHMETGKIYNIVLPLDYLTISLGNTFQTIQLSVVEGTFARATFVASGYILEEFSVANTLFYDANYTRVFVNGEEWQRYACLYDMPADAKGYIITQSLTEQFSIIFGNGVHGRRLQENDLIEVSYLTHIGEYGNLDPNATKNFGFLDALIDAEGNNVNGNNFFLVTMDQPMTGGISAESIADVRQMIGCNSRSLVLANADNYKLFLSRFSFVGYNNVWTDNDSMSVNINVLTNNTTKLTDPVKYFKLTKQDFILTESQKTLIKNTIDNSKQSFAGVTLNFVDPILRNFACFVYVKKNVRYDNDSIREQIKTVIAKYFINLKNTTTYIPKSDIVKMLLNNIDGLVSVDLTFVSEANETAYVTGTYEVYKQVWLNGTFQNIITKRTYDSANTLLLDDWNNIQLTSRMEYPVLLGGFRYYTEKNAKKDKSESIMLEPVNIYFI